MLLLIQQQVLKFHGYIELQPENIPAESQPNQFQREYLIAFGLADDDEINDLLNICLPHL